MTTSRRAGIKPASLIVVGLIAAGAGATGVLAVRHQRLSDELGTLKRDSAVLHDQLAYLQEQGVLKDRRIAELAEARRADGAELAAFRQTAAKDAASLAQLREEVGGLESDAARLQAEIKKAESEGTLKSERLGELTRQLKETQGLADKAAEDLRQAGFRGQELAHQVGKLQSRLHTTESSLEEARAAAARQQQTITVLKTDLTAKVEALGVFQRQALLLQQANADLLRELATRPRRSTSPWADWYQPSRDSKAAKATAAK